MAVNARFAQGLSTSLQTGLRALAQDVDAAMIFLADMPDVAPALIRRMIAAFDPSARPIVVPTHQGRRGHPVLWGRAFFPDLLARTAGDCGARRLLDAFSGQVHEIEADDAGVLTDLDTPQDWARRRFPPGL